MLDARTLSHKADRFVAVEDVSDQIFETFDPRNSSEPTTEIDRGRVRTRLLDFNFFRRPIADDELVEVAEKPCATCTQQQDQIPHFDEDQTIFGWLAVVDGAGRGQTFQLSKDVTCIGRGPDQDVSLNFGDSYISRAAHVTIHWDRGRDLIAVRFEGKSNPVSLDGKILSGTRLLKHKSLLTIGQTTLRFVKIDDPGSFWQA